MICNNIVLKYLNNNAKLSMISFLTATFQRISLASHSFYYGYGRQRNRIPWRYGVHSIQESIKRGCCWGAFSRIVMLLISYLPPSLIVKKIVFLVETSITLCLSRCSSYRYFGGLLDVLPKMFLLLEHESFLNELAFYMCTICARFSCGLSGRNSHPIKQRAAFQCTNFAKVLN